MTIAHPLYPEFLVRLAGPEGINLQVDGRSDDVGPTDTSKTSSILAAMGFEQPSQASSLAYFRSRGSVNDRQILSHPDITADDEQHTLEAVEHEHEDTFGPLSRHGHGDHAEAMRHLDED